MMVFDDGHFSHIKCDVCEKKAPPQEEMIKAGGLIRMGWYCSGGVHRCPDHAQEWR